MAKQFRALGNQIREPRDDLDVFEAPPGMTGPIIFKTDEFTSVCPITGQPDFSEVIIEYAPERKCLESKSLKLYLWTFREQGAFAESLAVKICDKVFEALEPKYCKVTINQAPRGGIGLQCTHIRWPAVETLKEA